MSCFFFFNDTATTEIYTLSLHDALPILFPGVLADRADWAIMACVAACALCASLLARRILGSQFGRLVDASPADRKSTRLNSSHSQISYAVFCLKKKTNSPRYTSDIRTRY